MASTVAKIQNGRIHPRVATDVKVGLWLPNGKRITGGRVRNISLGGVFVELDPPLPFGTELTLDFAIGGEDRSLKCGGFVVWSSKDQPNSATGSGIRLTDVSVQDMRRLAQFIDEHLASI